MATTMRQILLSGGENGLQAVRMAASPGAKKSTRHAMRQKSLIICGKRASLCLIGYRLGCSDVSSMDSLSPGDTSPNSLIPLDSLLASPPPRVYCGSFLCYQKKRNGRVLGNGVFQCFQWPASFPKSPQEDRDDEDELEEAGAANQQPANENAGNAVNEGIVVVDDASDDEEILLPVAGNVVLDAQTPAAAVPATGDMEDGEMPQVGLTNLDVLARLACFLDQETLSRFSQCNRDIYSVTVRRLWSTLRIRQGFLSRSLNALFVIMASPRGIGNYVRELVLDCRDLREAEKNPFIMLSTTSQTTISQLLDAEQGAFLPLLAASLPNISSLVLRDSSILPSCYEAMARRWPSLIAVQCESENKYESQGELRGTRAMPGQPDVPDFTPWMGCTEHGLRLLDLTGWNLRHGSASRAAQLIQHLPPLPHLQYLDLSFTGANSRMIRDILDCAPNLRCFGWGPFLQEAVPERQGPGPDGMNGRLSAKDFLLRCPELQVLVLIGCPDFFPKLQPVDMGDPAFRTGLRNLRSLTLRHNSPTTDHLASYLHDAEHFHTLEYDAPYRLADDLSEALATCGRSLERLGLPDLNLGPQPPPNVQMDGGGAADAVYRAIGEYCPNLEELVLDYRVRLEKASLISDIFEACARVKLGWAPSHVPQRIPPTILTFWEMQGRLLEFQEQSFTAQTLKETREGRAWAEALLSKGEGAAQMQDADLMELS